MTPKKAEEIFDKVIKEKQQRISLISSTNDTEELHNGINKNVADFLKSYNTDREKCTKEINAMKEEAETLYQEVTNKAKNV